MKTNEKVKDPKRETPPPEKADEKARELEGKTFQQKGTEKHG